MENGVATKPMRMLKRSSLAGINIQ